MGNGLRRDFDLKSLYANARAWLRESVLSAMALRTTMLRSLGGSSPFSSGSIEAYRTRSRTVPRMNIVTLDRRWMPRFVAGHLPHAVDDAGPRPQPRQGFDDQCQPIRQLPGRL